MTANITVVPDIPNASVRTAAVVNAFARQSPRHAARRSWVTASSMVITPRDAKAPNGRLTAAESMPYFDLEQAGAIRGRVFVNRYTALAHRSHAVSYRGSALVRFGHGVARRHYRVTQEQCGAPTGK